MRGLDPTLKSARLANYITALRMELLYLAHACGHRHPALVPLAHFEILDDSFGSRPAREVFHYEEGWGLPRVAESEELARMMSVA
jgi:glutamate synthase (ferredoxin)